MDPKIKICGLTRREQALEIASLGVDALGFVLFERSPRAVSPEKLKEILPGLPPFTRLVGVFVNHELDDLAQIMTQTGLDLAQLHGDETPEYCQELTSRGINWIKAIRVKKEADLKQMEWYHSEFFLLDAFSEAHFGGTGLTFDWQVAKKAQERYNIILAGGLNPENVKEACRAVQPYGIDLSSGVEVKPGVKSMEKVYDLLKVAGRID